MHRRHAGGTAPAPSVVSAERELRSGMMNQAHAAHPQVSAEDPRHEADARGLGTSSSNLSSTYAAKNRSMSTGDLAALGMGLGLRLPGQGYDRDTISSARVKKKARSRANSDDEVSPVILVDMKHH